MLARGRCGIPLGRARLRPDEWAPIRSNNSFMPGGSATIAAARTARHAWRGMRAVSGCSSYSRGRSRSTVGRWPTWRPAADRAPADPRHRRQSGELAGGDRSSGAALHGRRARPAGAWPVGAGGRDYSLGAFAPALRDLLVALGHERATLVGHSLGGGIAMQFAYQFPESTERLVLVSSGGLGREVSAVLRAAALPGADRFIATTAALGSTVGTSIGRGLRFVGLRPNTDVAEVARGYASLADHDRRGCLSRDAPRSHQHRRPARSCRRPALPDRRSACAHHLGRA